MEKEVNKMIRRITFGERKMNQPLKCFEVDVLGYKNIQENHINTKDNIETYSYTVVFKDNSSITINNAMIVSDR